MKNYEVEAIMCFSDKSAGIKRCVGDKFICDEERYKFLKKNNAVKLLQVIEEKEETATEEVIDKIVEEVIESEEVNKIIDEIVDETVNEILKEKPKKKKNKK